MAGWQGSNRRAELPRDWRKIRNRIFKRDGYRCTAVVRGLRCRAVPTDVDHVGPKDDHSDENLTSLCDQHHKSKSGAQGARAKAAKLARVRRSYRRSDF